MKRTLLVILAVVALAAVVPAQQRRMAGPPRNAGTAAGQPGQPPDPTAALKAALGLTDAQVDSIKALLQTRRDRADAIQTLPLLPLRGTVVFPQTVVPLAAAQPRSLRLIDEVMSGDRTVALVMQKDAELEGAGPDDVFQVGTISTIHQMMRVPDGTVRLAVQGVDRMRIVELEAE